MKRIRRVQAGFTLIELMIVIAIIGILAGILVPNYVKARAQGIATACKSNLKTISTVLEMYAHDNAGRYPTALASLNPTYLKVVPTCPSVGATSVYINGFTSRSQPDGYTVMCSGTNHSGVGYSANYPQYSSTSGLSER